MSWISDEAACRKLIHEKAPALWGEIQDAIERDLEEYGKLFPAGPVSITKSTRENDSIEVEFRVNESDQILHSSLISVLVSFRFRNKGAGLAVVSTTWKGGVARDIGDLYSKEFEISSCRGNAPLITTSKRSYTPQEVAKDILAGALFCDRF